MTILNIALIVVAYIALWFFVLKCNKIINKTCEKGKTCREIIHK